MNENKESSILKETEAANKLMAVKILDYVIAGSIALAFFLVPLFFTNLTLQGFGFDKMVLFYFLVLIGVTAWLARGVVVGELSLKRTPLDAPLLITLALFGVSAALSIGKKDSLIGSYGNSAKGLIAIIFYILFFYLLVNNTNLKRVKLFFGSIVASGILLVFYSLLQISGKYLLPMDFTHNQGVNPIGSLSGLTRYLIIILPLFVVAAAQAKEIFPKAPKFALLSVKIVSGLAIISAMAILALLNGFTFWPVLIVGLIVLLMFFLSKIVRISMKNMFIPLVVFFVSIIFLVIGNFRVNNLDLPAEISLSRSASWSIAKGAVAENPIFGSGLATFDYDFSKFKSVNFNMSPLWDARFDSATGALFELLATVGVPGTIMVIVLFLTSISILFLALMKKENGEGDSMVVALFAGFISVVLLAFLFPQDNSSIILSVLISILATAAGIEMYPEKFKAIRLSFRAEAKYALTLAAMFLLVSSGIVILFVVGGKIYMADVYIKKSLTIEDLMQKNEKISKAIKLADYQDIYHINSANNFMSIANQMAGGDKDQKEIANVLNSAVEQVKQALAYAPNRVINNESLAMIYENAPLYIKGSLELAIESYKKAAELDPQSPNLYLRMALVDMVKSNTETVEDEKKYYIEEAIRKYDEGIVKKSDFAPAYYGKAIANEKLGKIDDAIEQLKNANLIDGSNLDYRFELARLYFNRGFADQGMEQGIPTGANGQDLNKPAKQAGDEAQKRDDDLKIAEQLLLSILVDPSEGGNPKHANARYNLAILYQRIGEKDKAKLMADYLVNNVLQDQAEKDAVKAQFANLR